MPNGCHMVEEVTFGDKDRDWLGQPSGILDHWPVRRMGGGHAPTPRPVSDLPTGRPLPHPNPDGLGHGLRLPQLPEPKAPVRTENG